MEVKKKSVSLQPISEERVLERALKQVSGAEQIIDNIEKDNEVKQQREARKSSAINRIAGLQFRGKRESEREFTQEKREGYKSGRGMPRLPEARKDVASCEKARGSASGKRSGHVRMGQPGRLKAGHQA